MRGSEVRLALVLHLSYPGVPDPPLSCGFKYLLCRGRGRRPPTPRGEPAGIIPTWLFLPGLHDVSLHRSPNEAFFFSRRRTWKIVSRARIWQPFLFQSVATCSFPPTSGRQATGLMSREAEQVASPPCRGPREATVLVYPPPSGGSLPARLSAVAVPRPTDRGDTDPWVPPRLYFQTHIYSLDREKTQVSQGRS